MKRTKPLPPRYGEGIPQNIEVETAEGRRKTATVEDNEQEYATILPCYDQLRDILIEAQREFDEGDERQDGGRQGMARALFGTMLFLAGEAGRRGDIKLGILTPLHELVHALVDLEIGHQHPALTRRKISHRKSGSQKVLELKACCIVAAEFWKDVCGSQKVADRKVRAWIAPSAKTSWRNHGRQ